MSDFWNVDIKEDENLDSFEMGGSLEPIPDKTDVLAAPYEAKWDEYQGEEYISISWNVLKPQAYSNRKIFQKLKVNDPKKAEKAKRMLMAIDANAGGHLRASGKLPTDGMLTKALLNKQMILKVGVWKIDDKSGNWVMAVSPKSKGLPAEEPAAQAQDDDIGVPF